MGKVIIVPNNDYVVKGQTRTWRELVKATLREHKKVGEIFISLIYL